LEPEGPARRHRRREPGFAASGPPVRALGFPGRQTRRRRRLRRGHSGPGALRIHPIPRSGGAELRRDGGAPRRRARADRTDRSRRQPLGVAAHVKKPSPLAALLLLCAVPAAADAPALGVLVNLEASATPAERQAALDAVRRTGASFFALELSWSA